MYPLIRELIEPLRTISSTFQDCEANNEPSVFECLSKPIICIPDEANFTSCYLSLVCKPIISVFDPILSPHARQDSLRPTSNDGRRKQVDLVRCDFATTRDLVGTEIYPFVHLLVHENVDRFRNKGAVIETSRTTKCNTMISRNVWEVWIPRTL
jgi:hypothetical protein